MQNRLWFSLGLVAGSGVLAFMQFLAGSHDGWIAVGLAALVGLIVTVDWLTHAREPPSSRARDRPRIYVEDNDESRRN